MTLSAVDLLPELVAIPSVSGSEGALADFVVATCVREGVSIERVGASLVLKKRRGEGPRLLLNTHLDTVPVGQGWTREPHGDRWLEGRLWGRGANDAKASVAAMLAAFVAQDERELPLGEVWLALTASEETTNAGMAEVLERCGRPDGAVTGEPTGLEVVRAQAGLAVVTAEWRGRACHAAHVARVAHDNALLMAAEELSETAPFLELDGEHELLGASTAVATILRAGERSNVIPDRAEAVFDARLSPLHRGADVVELLARHMPTALLCIQSERLKPVETPADHPLVRAALRCAGKTRAIGSSTLSDMALLAGIPAIKCGPGQTERSHTSDEFVMADEVMAGELFYRRLIPAALAALAGAEALS